MINLARIGLTNSDFEGPVDSKEEVIHEVCTSGRLFQKVLHYVILNKLRVYFQQPDLAEGDDIKPYFPLLRRRSSWRKFQLGFDLSVPGLSIPNSVFAFAAVYFLFTVVYVVWGVVQLPPVEIVLFYISNWLTDYAIVHIFFLSIPMVVILGLAQLKLPENVEGLVDAIRQENLERLFANEKAGLKLFIEEQLSEEGGGK